MLRITDAEYLRKHLKSAKYDPASDQPVLVVADVLKIKMYRYDESPVPRIIAIVAHIDPSTGEESHLTTEVHIEGDDLADLMTPKPGQKTRAHGDFRMADLEDAIANWYAREETIGKDRTVTKAAVAVERDATLENRFAHVVQKAREHGQAKRDAAGETAPLALEAAPEPEGKK